MIVAPSATVMSASCASTRPLSRIGIKILPIDDASARASGAKRDDVERRSPSKTAVIGLPPRARSMTSWTSLTLMPARDLIAIHRDAQLRLVGLVDRGVGRPRIGCSTASACVASALELAEVGPADDDREIGGRSGGDLGRRVDDRLREVERGAGMPDCRRWGRPPDSLVWPRGVS
jgi:hypothetical protein